MAEDAFIIAACGGDINLVREYINNGGNVNYQTNMQDWEKEISTGDTGLVVAARHDKMEVVEILLEEHDADPNIQNKDGWTSLMLASYGSCIDSVRVLLKHAADPNIQNSQGSTSLMLACRQGPSADIVKLLLEYAANPNKQDNDGETSLMTASSRGYTDIVKLLVEYGADPNIKNKNGNTSLLEASSRGHTDTVRVLLVSQSLSHSLSHSLTHSLTQEQGADPNIQNNEDWTPLMFASKQGPATDTVRLLLENVANPNTQDKIGLTSLMKASQQGHTDNAIVLLVTHSLHHTLLLTHSLTHYITQDHGADPNIQDKYHETSLIKASYRGHTETVGALLDKGADINMQSKLGDTALIIACKEGRSETVNMLLARGADIAMQTKGGKTALSLTKHPAIKSLIERHINWNRRKALIMVLAENGYFRSSISVTLPSSIDVQPLRYESILGNEVLVRVIVGFI